MTQSRTHAPDWTPVLSAPASCDCANGHPDSSVRPHEAVKTALEQHAVDMNHFVGEFAYLVRGFLTPDHSDAAPSGESRIAS